MKQMFNRGFTKGYLLHDNNFMAKEYPGNRGIDLGTVVDYDKKRKVVKSKTTIKHLFHFNYSIINII